MFAVFAAIPLTAFGQTSFPNPFMMLHFDNSFIDSAMNIVGGSSGALISSTEFVSGGSSAYFDDNFLTYVSYSPKDPIKPVIDVGTADFTIDFWVFPLEEPENDGQYHGFFYAFNQNPLVGNDPVFTLLETKNKVCVQQIDMTNDNNGVHNESNDFQVCEDKADNFQINQWNHIAVQRKDGLFNIALNGRLSAWSYGNLSGSAVTLNVPLSLRFQGKSWAGGFVPFKGYIDEFRVTKNATLWSLPDNASFTPPTEYPLPEVVPVITVSDPGGKTFNWGDTIPIKWTAPGVPYSTRFRFKLFNDENGDLVAFEDYRSSFKDGKGTGDFLAVPPGRYRIEVSLPYTNVSGQSASFTVSGSVAESAQITIDEPVGGSTLRKGTFIPVRWTGSDIPSAVKFFLIKLFNKNNELVMPKRFSGLSFAYYANDKWNRDVYLPSGLVSGEYRIEVSLPYTNVSGRSDLFFVDPGTITVTAPADGSTFNQKADIPVTWTSSNISADSDIRIELFKDNDTLVETRIETNNDGSFVFNLIKAPPPPGRYYIKVSLNDSSIISAESARFTITGTEAEAAKITVTEPVDGSTFEDRVTVRWTGSNLPDNASFFIKLFKDDGQLADFDYYTYYGRDISYINGEGKIDVSLTAPYGQYFIKVDSWDSDIVSSRSGSFTINPPPEKPAPLPPPINPATITNVTVAAEDRGLTTVEPGEIVSVKWNTSGIPIGTTDPSGVLYVGFFNEANVEVQKGFNYPWVWNTGIRNFFLSVSPGRYYIKVCLPYSDIICGRSNWITVNPATITVTAPAVGSAFNQKADIPVTWVSSDLSLERGVYIRLYKANGDLVMEDYKPNSGAAALALSNVPPLPGDYYIKVVLIGFQGVFGQSNPFTITGTAAEAARIAVTAPVGGSTFDNKARIPVAWTSANLPTGARVYVKLFNENDVPVFGAFEAQEVNMGSVTLDLSLLKKPLFQGRYYIGVDLSSSISAKSAPFTITGPSAPVDTDVTGIPSSLLLHFDEATPPYKDSSGNGSAVTAFVGVALPSFTTAEKKFGAGAISFNGKKEIEQQQALAVLSSANGNLSFGDDDFTIDFWVSPDKLEDGTILFYLEDESGDVNKRLTLFVDSTGWLNLQSGSISLDIESGLEKDAWNHIAIQRKKVGTVTFLGLSVNGKVGNWTALDSTKSILLSGPFKIIGFGWPFSGVGGSSNAFEGVIDEFRVVKGRALWGEVASGDSFTLPLAPAISVSTITLPDILGGEDVQPETATTPERPVSPVSSEAALSREEKIGTSTVERPVAREMLIKKVNGDRNYTVYFDANDEHKSTVFWEDNTSDKKLKEFEYEASGGLYREKYYNRDGAETDIISYYPRAEGGGIKQEVKKRQQKNGSALITIETLSGFDAGGRMIHTQQYRGEELLFAKTFSYDGDNLTSDLFYAGVNNWEKNEYEYENTTPASGDGSTPFDKGDTAPDEIKLKKITNTRRLPAAIEGSASVISQTTSLFENGKLKSARRISAPLDVEANKVEDISYRVDGQITLIDIFDFEHNVKTHIPYQEIATGRTAPEYEYNVKITTEDPMAYTNYGYELGGLKSKGEVTFLDNNVSKFGTVTTYSTKGKGKKIRETALSYQANPGPNGQLLFETQTVRYFDEAERVALEQVFYYRDGEQSPYQLKHFNGAGLITMVADIENNNFATKKLYYGSKTADADNQWFEVNYLYGGDAPLTMEHYYVGAGEKVLSGSGKYRYNAEKKQYKLIGPATVNKLAKKKLGDAIVSSLSLTTTDELPRIAEAVEKILRQYQGALSALVSLGSTSRREVEELYVKFARKAVYAIYSIEYKTWTDAASLTKDLTKGLIDDRALENVATEWVGIDRDTGLPFRGLYIFPRSSATKKLATDAAFVDFSEGGLADSISKAGSYGDLKSIATKSEKWDALPVEGAYEVKIKTGGQMVVYNEVSGGYLTVDELTKRDPSIMLLVDRLFADLEAKAVTMSGSGAAAEKETIKKVYEYFFNKSLFTYLWDLGGTTQTVGQTFARGGGNSGDFAAVFLSVLREVFYRLGNSDIQTRLSSAPVMVSAFAPISAENIGAGHGGTTYEEPAAAGGKLYYIEPSYLFKGGGTLYYDNILLPLTSSFPLDGKDIPMAQTNAISDHNWYVALDTTNAIQGVAKQYRKMSLFTPESPQAVSLVSNSSEKVASIPSYIEPYDENVNDLANYFIRYIPDMDAHSPEFIAEYIHSEFSKLTEYEAETKPNDVWKRVSGVSGTLAGIIGTKVNPILSTNGTLSGNKITGDCEDLAFAEASVLQNILTKYYMRRGYTAYNAAAKAQSQVFLLAERNYEGDTTKDPHLYVAFVTEPEPRGTSGATIMILDPQDGSITPQLPFEIVLNDNYLFYANSSKVSAVSFYDWSALRLSAAVGGTLQQAIDAVSGVRPATDFKFSEKAQNYIQELQTKTGQAARNEITLMSEETANQTLADPNATFADKEAAAQAILIMSGSEVSAEPLPPKEASDFPQKTATAVANFLKKVNQAVKSLIGTVIPGYGAPRLPPTGKTYSGEPVNPYDIIPDPNFDYYSAVGNQEIIDPSQTLDNLEYYSAIGNTVLRTEQREPSAEIPTVPPPTFVFTGVHTKDPGIRYNQLLNRYEVDFYRGEPGALQCKSQYYMCTRDSAYNTSYTRFYGNTKIDEEGNTVENKPKNSHWQGGEGACSTTEFSCDKRVYYEGWECDKGWKWKDENEDKVKDPGDSCEPYTVGDPLNSPPTQPQICGPKKGLPGEKYEYSFESEDSDKPHPENISDRQNDAKRQARNEPYLSNGTVNPLYKPTDPTIPLPFDDWTNGKLFYDIKIGARLIDNFSLPPYDVVKREHSYTASGKAEDTKKTALLSWSDVGTKEIKAFAKDSHEAVSATSELAVTIGTSDFTVSGTVGACSVGPADGAVTVNWAPANANTLTPDGFYLYRKLAGEDDVAFARVVTDAPLDGAARSYAVTGLDAGAEYVFAVAPFVSNNCGGTFTLATTTAEAVTPVRCPMPDLKANAPALSDEYGNFTGGENGNVLGAGEITIRGTVNNRGAAATANGAFKNRFDDRVGSVSGSAPGSWDALQTVPLVNTSALSAGATNRTVKEHTWTGGIGTWDFLLTADTNNEVTEENEENNISDPITVEIVDFTPTLAANPATALAGDTIAFTASAVRQGNVENPQAVAFSNPLCGAGGTMVSPLTASTENDTSASFSCTYGTPGTKTATVSASYYKIPKTASANVTITLSSSTVTPTVRACAATAVDAGKVTLNWLDVSGEEGYRIYKWDTNDTSVLPPPDSTVSADVTTQTITDLTPGSRYYFKVASYSAAVESLSSVVSSLASEQCPDLIVEPGSIEMLDSAGNMLNPPTVIAPVSGNSSVSFRAKIRNQGGATATTFKNQFSVDGNTGDLFAVNSRPTLNGLGAGTLSVVILSDLWTISTERVGAHTLEVCADRPPTGKGLVQDETSETNNCLPTPFSFTVISPLTVNLGGRKANTADTYGNTVIVDYAQRGAELQWTTTGNPATCASAGDTAGGSWSGGLVPASPIGSKTFTLPSIGQLLYTFTVTCSRP